MAGHKSVVETQTVNDRYTGTNACQLQLQPRNNRGAFKLSWQLGAAFNLSLYLVVMQLRNKLLSIHYIYCV